MNNKKHGSCPKCRSAQMRVTDSRVSRNPDSMRHRRRVCDDRGFRFSTEEMVVGEKGTGADEVYYKVRRFEEDLDALIRKHFSEGESLLSVGSRVGMAGK